MSHTVAYPRHYMYVTSKAVNDTPPQQSWSYLSSVLMIMRRNGADNISVSKQLLQSLAVGDFCYFRVRAF